MMKFASFETIVEAIYEYLPGKKSDYGRGAQTGVSFAGGYMAGILCAIVSHPADVMVSKLSAQRLPGEAFGAAMSRIYKDIGFGGLWNGLIIRIFMIGTLTSLRKYPLIRSSFRNILLTEEQNGASTIALRSCEFRVYATVSPY
jgi:solute carrier family 25 phosphate transporter 3